MNQQFGTNMMMMGGQPYSGQQMQRIHQNSLFGGQESQMSGNPQVQRIHQSTMQNGMMAQPQYAQNGGFNQGFQNQSFNQGFQNQNLPNGGGLQQNQGFNTFPQGFQNQGMQNSAPLQRIHQNSLYGGQESSYSSPQVQRIHEASMQNGMMAQPQINQYGQQSFGGGFNQGFQNQGFQNQAFNQGFQNQSLPNGGGLQQNLGFNQGGMMMGGQPFTQSTIPQQQLDRIHQASLFQGQSQLDNPALGQIHQRTLNGEEANVMRAGFGGGSMMGGSMMGGNMGSQMGMMGNQGAFRAVMNADQFTNRFDSEGPSSYPASMYTGQNQYDHVNQSVLNQMVGRQF